MNPLDKLSEIFSEFPGIGPRQAKRFVYFLLTKDKAYLRRFADLMDEMKENVRVCESCFKFFNEERSKNILCEICRNPNRDKTLLAIVSRDNDLENVEKSHSFDGLYFVLGGSVPILEKEPERKIRQKELLKIVIERAESSDNAAKKPLKEVILAMSSNAEGENTADYIRSLLSPLAEKNGFKISALGKGLSTGTELEYSDAETLKNALKNRQ